MRGHERRTARRLTRAGLLAVGVAVGAGAVGAGPAAAQADLLGPGAVFVGAGVSGIATAELDDRLSAAGYPTFGRTAAAVSLGAYRVLSGGLMLGGEWHGLIMGEEPHAGGEVGLGGGYGTLGIGYAVRLSPRARVYPRLGLGVGGMGVWIESPDDGIPFDDILDAPEPAPARTPVLSRGGAVVDVGGGVELLPRDGGGLLIGVRFGYLVAPPNARWRTYGREVTGGPEASIGGPYLRVAIGAAWRR